MLKSPMMEAGCVPLGGIFGIWLWIDWYLAWAFVSLLTMVATVQMGGNSFAAIAALTGW